METAKLLELAQSAARKFAAPILGPVQSQDKEDMEQEAACTIWEVHTRKPEKPNSYLHQVGYYAAGQWWRRFVLHIKDNAARAHNGRRFKPSLDEPLDEKRTLSDVVPAPVEDEPSEPAPLLTEERISKIANWLVAYSDFFTTRHKRAQALRILNLLERGHNTASIAVELSLSEYTVRQYRREIRAALTARLARQKGRMATLNLLEGGRNGHH
jgi:DNA-directed RNA polymerase specialized sigma24 family protein